MTSTDPAVERPALPEATARGRVIAVLRADDPARYAPVIDTLAEAGVRSMELTLTTPGTLEALPGLVERYAGAVDIGVGTVTTAQQAERAGDGGADYLVTPVTDAEVIAAAARAGVPIVPGGLTPTELHAGWRAGAAAVKVFPASLVGPGYVKDLRGPFPDLRVIPSGGVDLEAARAWIAAGADAVSVGGPLLGSTLKDAPDAAALTALAERASTFVEACAR